MEIVCNKCQISKPAALFESRYKTCKECRKVYFQKLYQKRSGYVKNNVNAHRKKRLQICRLNVLEYLKSHPCVDCGETDLLMLDFDHLNNKVYCVSRMVNLAYEWEIIKKEIDKCVVRCVKCHRRKTAKEQGWWKLLPGVV